MADDPGFEQVSGLIDRFVARAREELDIRCQKWGADLSQKESYEVVGALLARQVTLATQLAECPPIWNGHVAPIILRAMADVYITLAWILREPTERARKFIHYGLGQEKLLLERRRAELADREATSDEAAYFDATERWIDGQRLTFLTNVNVGSWSGINTRKMSEEADCLDFYNFVYTPFSACSHSMWHHIARYNLKQCANPLHQFHGIPTVPELAIDAHYVYLGARYLRKAFGLFDDTTGISIEGQSAFDVLREGLDVLSDRNGVGESDPSEPAPGSGDGAS